MHPLVRRLEMVALRWSAPAEDSGSASESSSRDRAEGWIYHFASGSDGRSRARYVRVTSGTRPAAWAGLLNTFEASGRYEISPAGEKPSASHQVIDWRTVRVARTAPSQPRPTSSPLSTGLPAPPRGSLTRRRPTLPAGDAGEREGEHPRAKLTGREVPCEPPSP